MKQFVRFLMIGLTMLPLSAYAQFEQMKDSIVQLYGVVMTADSLRGIPAVTVKLYNQNRGTYTNEQGVFSIVVMKGDIIDFSSVGFISKRVVIPRNLEGNSFSIIQLMVTDTVYLPATIIRARPSREQFERDFVNAKIPDDQYEIARKNIKTAQSRIFQQSLPADAGEASRYIQRQTSQRYYYQGQLAPQNILNPTAWAEFIQAWKRGDFKKR